MCTTHIIRIHNDSDKKSTGAVSVEGYVSTHLQPQLEVES